MPLYGDLAVQDGEIVRGGRSIVLTERAATNPALLIEATGDPSFPDMVWVRRADPPGSLRTSGEDLIR
jgi:hypothetical protein